MLYQQIVTRAAILSLATKGALCFFSYVNSVGDRLLWLDSKLRSLMVLISVGQEYLCLIITYAAIVKSIMAVM